MAEYGVVLFHSTAHAIRAEQVLLAAGLKIKLIPTPRRLSANCGMAVRFERPDEARVARLLGESGVPVSGVFGVE